MSAVGTCLDFCSDGKPGRTSSLMELSPLSNNTQPSPKDSGVDVSSPSRRDEDAMFGSPQVQQAASSVSGGNSGSNCTNSSCSSGPFESSKDVFGVAAYTGGANGAACVGESKGRFLGADAKKSDGKVGLKTSKFYSVDRKKHFNIGEFQAKEFRKIIMSDPKEKKKKCLSLTKASNNNQSLGRLLGNAPGTFTRRDSEDTTKNYAVAPIEEKKIGIVIRVTKPFSAYESKKRKISVDKSEPAPKKPSSVDATTLETGRSSSVDRSSNMSPTMPELHKETPFVETDSLEENRRMTRSRAVNPPVGVGHAPPRMKSNLRSATKSMPNGDQDIGEGSALLPPVITAMGPEQGDASSVDPVSSYVPKKITCKLAGSVIVKTLTADDPGGERRQPDCRKSKSSKSSKSSKNARDYLQVKSISGLKIKLAKPKFSLPGRESDDQSQSRGSEWPTTVQGVSEDRAAQFGARSPDRFPNSSQEGVFPAYPAIRPQSSVAFYQPQAFSIESQFSDATIVTATASKSSFVPDLPGFQLEADQDGKVKFTQEKEVVMPDGKKKKLKLKMFVPSPLPFSSPSLQQEVSNQRPSERLPIHPNIPSDLTAILPQEPSMTSFDFTPPGKHSELGTLTSTSSLPLKKPPSCNLLPVPALIGDRNLETQTPCSVALGNWPSPRVVLSQCMPWCSSAANVQSSQKVIGDTCSGFEFHEFPNAIGSIGSGRDRRSEAGTFSPGQSQDFESQGGSSTRGSCKAARSKSFSTTDKLLSSDIPTPPDGRPNVGAARRCETPRSSDPGGSLVDEVFKCNSVFMPPPGNLCLSVKSGASKPQPEKTQNASDVDSPSAVDVGRPITATGLHLRPGSTHATLENGNARYPKPRARRNSLETAAVEVVESDDYREMPRLEKNDISQTRLFEKSNKAQIAVQSEEKNVLESKRADFALPEKENHLEKPSKRKTFKFDGLELEYSFEKDSVVEDGRRSVRRLRNRSKEEKKSEKAETSGKLEPKRKRGASRTSAKKLKVSAVPADRQASDEFSNQDISGGYREPNGLLLSPTVVNPDVEKRGPAPAGSMLTPSPGVSLPLDDVDCPQGESEPAPNLTPSSLDPKLSSPDSLPSHPPSSLDSAACASFSAFCLPVSSAAQLWNSAFLGHPDPSSRTDGSHSRDLPAFGSNRHFDLPVVASHCAPFGVNSILASADANLPCGAARVLGSPRPAVAAPPSPLPPPPPPKFVRSFKEVDPAPLSTSSSPSVMHSVASTVLSSSTIERLPIDEENHRSGSLSSLDQSDRQNTDRRPSFTKLDGRFSPGLLSSKTSDLASGTFNCSFVTPMLAKCNGRDKSALFEEKSNRLHRISQRLQANSAISLKVANVQNEERSDDLISPPLPSDDGKQTEAEQEKIELEEEAKKRMLEERLKEYYLNNEEDIAQYIANQTQLVKLRNKAYRLFCCLFPEAQTPLRLSPDSEAIDQLIESAVSVLESGSKVTVKDCDRMKPEDLDVLTKSATKSVDSSDVCDERSPKVEGRTHARVSLCCRPKGCLSRLQGLVRRFLCLVLPHLDAYLASDASLSVMDKIVDRVVLANCAFIGFGSNNGPGHDPSTAGEEENVCGGREVKAGSSSGD